MVTEIEDVIRKAEGKPQRTKPKVIEIEDIQAKLKKEIREARVKVLKKRIGEVGKVTERGIREVGKTYKSLQKGLAKGAKARRKEILRARIVREKLLQAIVSKQREGRPVNIMRNVTDKIPDVFTNPEKKKPTFLGRGGLL